VLRPIQPQPERLTQEGFVPSSASLAAVPPPLRPLLDRAVAACRQELGRRLVGVYLRGSLVQEGCFLPGVSDADFLAVYLEAERDADGAPSQRSAAQSDAQARLQAAAQRLHSSFPECTKVALVLREAVWADVREAVLGPSTTNRWPRCHPAGCRWS
jgi:hypothetical protein